MVARASTSPLTELNSEIKSTFQVANGDIELGDIKSTPEIVQSLLGTVRSDEPMAPSIYMAPRVLREIRPGCFSPRVVSIGPLHKKNDHLKEIEQQKSTYLRSLLGRSKIPQEQLALECVDTVNISIKQIRSCYAEKIPYTDAELVQMMVMDSCFILEFLIRSTNDEGPVLGNKLLDKCTLYDLVLLENQIPFFVLQDIFEHTILKSNPTVSLTYFLLQLLRDVNIFQDHDIINNIYGLHSYNTFGYRHDEHTPCHILGLLHECYSYEHDPVSGFSSKFKINTAVQLKMAGVNFKPNKHMEWPMEMKLTASRYFCCGCTPTLKMPVLYINDYTELLLRNLIAYEQCCQNAYYVTSYVMAMDMLIDTGEDVTKLIESKVLVNNLIFDEDVAYMINNICKETVLVDFFYMKEWRKLDRFCKGYIPRTIVWLKRTYPWNVIGLLGGIVLFVLTVIQTIFTVDPVGSK